MLFHYTLIRVEGIHVRDVFSVPSALYSHGCQPPLAYYLLLPLCWPQPLLPSPKSNSSSAKLPEGGARRASLTMVLPSLNLFTWLSTTLGTPPRPVTTRTLSSHSSHLLPQTVMSGLARKNCFPHRHPGACMTQPLSCQSLCRKHSSPPPLPSELIELQVPTPSHTAFHSCRINHPLLSTQPLAYTSFSFTILVIY